MPITSGGTMTTQAGVGMPQVAGATSANPFQSMIGGLQNMQGFQFNTPKVSGSNPTYQDVMGMLTQQPTSLTNQLMPGLSQILGLQTESMLPYFQQQTQQGVAQQQTAAQQRGLTGSSIEAAGMLGAQQAGTANMNQFIAQQLGQLGGAYQQGMTQDVNTQNQMYQNVAQAMGQQMANQIQQEQFNRALAEQSYMSSKMGQNQLWGSLISGGLGAAGMLGGAAILSDERLKDNKIPLGKVNGLTLYSFEYKQDTGLDLPTGRHFGFMAQEVEKVFPDAVMEVKGHKMIDLDKFIPAMQEK
jgi:hypothetical protein